MTTTLWKKCTEVKIELSKKGVSFVDIRIDSIIPDIDLDLKISRTQYDKICKPILLRCMEPLRKSLKEAKISKTEVDEIILVGGSTRIILIRQMLKEFFGKKLNKSLNLDEAIAYGACV